MCVCVVRLCVIVCIVPAAANCLSCAVVIIYGLCIAKGIVYFVVLSVVNINIVLRGVIVVALCDTVLCGAGDFLFIIVFVVCVIITSLVAVLVVTIAMLCVACFYTDHIPACMLSAVTVLSACLCVVI